MPKFNVKINLIFFEHKLRFKIATSMFYCVLTKYV